MFRIHLPPSIYHAKNHGYFVATIRPASFWCSVDDLKRSGGRESLCSCTTFGSSWYRASFFSDTVASFCTVSSFDLYGVCSTDMCVIRWLLISSTLNIVDVRYKEIPHVWTLSRCASQFLFVFFKGSSR